jgi:hypothetical protein
MRWVEEKYKEWMVISQEKCIKVKKIIQDSNQMNGII